MNLRTEVSLAIDDHRVLWLTNLATDVDVEDVESVVEAQANAMLSQAIQAHDIVAAPQRKNETRMPPTFGEDDE